MLGLLLLGASALLRPAPTSAHIPITTKIMFDKEVIRILQRNCIACHRPDGIAFSLASYKDARPWAKAIEVELLEGRMPPWRPVNGFGDFVNSPQLTQQDLDLVVNWVENGVPEGDPKELPAAPLYSDDWKLGKPDLTLQTGPSPKVKPGADADATYTLSTGFSEDRWVRGLDLRPGNSAIVHSAAFYLNRPGRVSTDENHRTALEELGVWVPGQLPYAPENAGWLLPAGSQIIVKIHYHNSGDQSDPAASDSSQVGLYLTRKAPAKEFVEAAVNCPDEPIPVDPAPHKVLAAYTLDAPSDVVAVRPAASPLMASLQVTACKPDGGDDVMLWTTGYKYDWAPDYYLRRPEKLPKGTRIEVVAYFDNSDNNRNNPYSPARRLRWADVSSGPLCSLLLARSENSTY